MNILPGSTPPASQPPEPLGSSSTPPAAKQTSTKASTTGRRFLILKVKMILQN